MPSHRRVRFLLLFGALGAARLALAADPPARTAFRNVKVLAMATEEIVPDQVVIVEEGRIAAVGPAGTTPIPEGARVIDGHGGTLIPGLFDLHTHVRFPEDFDLFLAHGVTTVLNLDGGTETLEWRAALRDGTLRGPRLLTCGPHVRGVHSEEEAAKVVAGYAATGYDCVKIYDDITAEGFSALVSHAREKGLNTIAHIPRNLKWQDAMEARPGAIAHAEEFLYSPVLDGDEARIAAGMKAGSISLIATLTTYDIITRQIAGLGPFLERPEMSRLSPMRTMSWGPGENTYQKRFDEDAVPRMRALLVFQRDLVRTLRQGGIRILAGTDAGGPPFVFPGSSLIDEIVGLVSAGLTPYEALRGATVDAAAFLGISDRAGTIAVGKEADMILVRANPLLFIENIALQSGVMARGRWYDQSDLRSMLRSLEETFGDERRFLAAIETEGLDAALARAPGLRLSARGLNELGYHYLRVRNDAAGAVRLFDLYSRRYASDWNAWDSLSEALEAAGSSDRAMASCHESLRLNPFNDGCRERIDRLAQ